MVWIRSVNPAAVEFPPISLLPAKQGSVFLRDSQKLSKRQNTDYFVAIERKLNNNNNAPKTIELLRMFREYNQILGEKELNQFNMEIDYVPGEPNVCIWDHFLYSCWYYYHENENIIIYLFSDVPALLKRVSTISQQNIYFIFEDSFRENLTYCNTAEQISEKYQKRIKFWPCNKPEVS